MEDKFKDHDILPKDNIAKEITTKDWVTDESKGIADTNVDMTKEQGERLPEDNGNGKESILGHP